MTFLRERPMKVRLTRADRWDCKIGGQTRLGIDREVFRRAIREAHTVRPRFTILSLLDELGILERYLPELEERFYEEPVACPAAVGMTESERERRL